MASARFLIASPRLTNASLVIVDVHPEKIEIPKNKKNIIRLIIFFTFSFYKTRDQQSNVHCF
jgi:hypothetical protein